MGWQLGVASHDAPGLHAQAGWDALGDRSPVSHVNSIALFRLTKLRRPFSPLLIGDSSVAMWIVGFPSPSQAKDFIFLVSIVLISLGMPCAFVRYCVHPLMVHWMIVLQPSIEGQVLSHLASEVSIFSIIGDHIAWLLVSLPSHTLRIRIATPSFAIWMWGDIGGWSGSLVVSPWFLIC